MTIATYLSENKVAVIATTIGGVVVTASFVLYAKNELKRRQDQVVLEQQLSSLRFRFCNRR
ncbi:unnamed protein product [Anisakis simplex]|uniref:TMhelix containing protein n=1 Tax=Anisakis simplex TaxID=6269 RepID=A0A0M3JCJ3_ANISI|nr:unnamed protein product [Anisakis simplex]